ncbi:MAG: hypothetical protein V2J08_07975, partial [Desulfotignum sp.]|nr:hypothetical protein [Desulfotignum sp.]
MKKKITLLLILSVFFICFSTLTANAKTWYVDAAAGPGGSGDSWTEAFQDIQTAIDHASSLWMQCFAPQDKIYVRAGTYNLSATIDLDKVVGIYGGFPPAGNPGMADRNWQTYATIIDGRNLRQCISARSSYFLIDGFTIRNGDATFGAGLYAEKTPVYCSLIGYMASVVRNCTFINNEALNGGAVYDGGADLKITNCRFLNNHSRSAGGAIFSSYGSPQISKCTFTGNTAVTNGGAICGYWANQTTDAVSYIFNSVFHNNSANLGGAIHSYIFYPRIWNCTIAQ